MDNFYINTKALTENMAVKLKFYELGIRQSSGEDALSYDTLGLFIFKDGVLIHSIINENDYKEIKIDDFLKCETLDDVQALIKPKEKKRYWQWKLNTFTGWERINPYLDDNGYDTKGVVLKDWDKMEKTKIEDDYIEV